MEWLYDDGPIIACSSGNLENTAITVIRLSGFASLSIFKGFFNKDPLVFRPHRTTFCHLLDPDTEELVDQVVCSYFEGPNSFNGENILELSVHGNRIHVNKIIKLFVRNNIFRMAGAGEFTYRALRNNKLSLPQVEGLDLLLNASSDYSADQGLQLLCGDLNSHFLSLRSKYLDMRSHFELNMDFSEDVGEKEADFNFKQSFEALKLEIDFLYKRVGANTNFVLGPEIVLYGKVNAGKSSLFNLLLSEERSIVSSTKGTTRDYVSERLTFKDIEFKILDTAGLRKTSNQVEREGIRRGMEKVEKSFFSILVINPFDSFVAEDITSAPDLLVFTHADLDGFSKSVKDHLDKLTCRTLFVSMGGPIGPEKSGPIGPEKGGPIGPVLTSREKIFSSILEEAFLRYSSLISDNPILLERHKEQISKIHHLADELGQVLEIESDLGILSNEISRLGASIEELVGTLPPDQILKNIFDNFCIGK